MQAQRSATRGLFVTGTGTEVGKTVVAASIVAALTARGERVAAFKPAVSGLDESSETWPPDHELLAATTGWQKPSEVTPHTFGPAVSPHLAASESGVSISLEQLLAALAAASAEADVTVCEGVGGLLVPLSDDPPLSVLDFARSAGFPIIVAAHPGLGTISDTRLTVDRLRAEGLEVAGVVLSGWPERPSPIELSNLATLRALIDCDVATLPLTSPAQLAASGAELPLDDWVPRRA